MATTTTGDVVRYSLPASAIVDGDTVTRIDITIRGRTNGSGGDKMRVALVIDGTPRASADGGNLSASFADETLNDPDWNQDWTAAQMDGAQVDVTARQSGMPATVGHELDCFDVDATFTPAGGNRVVNCTTEVLELTTNAATVIRGAAAFPYYLIKQVRRAWKQMRLTL